MMQAVLTGFAEIGGLIPWEENMSSALPPAAQRNLACISTAPLRWVRRNPEDPSSSPNLQPDGGTKQLKDLDSPRAILSWDRAQTRSSVWSATCSPYTGSPGSHRVSQEGGWASWPHATQFQLVLVIGCSPWVTWWLMSKRQGKHLGGICFPSGCLVLPRQPCVWFWTEPPLSSSVQLANLDSGSLNLLPSSELQRSLMAL
jgi:hypothetical protein